MVSDFENLTYEERLKEMQLTTLEERREIGDNCNKKIDEQCGENR